MSYKTTNDLMQHLRDNGIAISGETQKQQLVTTGYYHGYKGYRFFKSAGARLPFSSYQELYATIQYDSALKALLKTHNPRVFRMFWIVSFAVTTTPLPISPLNRKSEPSKTN